jgi:diaminohydroxyphosphoribosylaminopyrimidine deaminase/5-amino-6-(5-phosphoribosylamino)uracil reductase
MTSEYLSYQVASTADGAIACADGTSQWITGPLARAHAQLLRAASQAILVGSGTSLADTPRLTVRLPEEQVR